MRVKYPESCGFIWSFGDNCSCCCCWKEGLIYPNIICFRIGLIIRKMAKQALIAAEAIKCCTFDESGPLRWKYCMTIHDQNENIVFSLSAWVVYQTLTNAHRCQVSARLFQLNVKSRCSRLHRQIVVWLVFICMSSFAGYTFSDMFRYGWRMIVGATGKGEAGPLHSLKKPRKPLNVSFAPYKNIKQRANI